MLSRLHLSIVFSLLSLAAAGVFGLSVISTPSLQGSATRAVTYRAEDVIAPQPVPSVPSVPSASAESSDLRVAKRLQARIQRQMDLTIDVRTLAQNIRQQRDLLSRSAVLTFRSSSDGTVVSVWTGGLVTSAHWLGVEVNPGGVQSTIDGKAIEREFQTLQPFVIPAPQRADILEVTEDDDGVLRAVTSGVAKTGFEFDPGIAAAAMTEALNESHPSADVVLTPVDSPLRNLTSTDLGQLRLLATGHSDFAGSGVGRKANVRKGTNKYLHNVIIEPGQKFSLNSVFANVPLHEWEMALAIFNGKDLRPVPGGGLCQVATTLYRAVLNAGLPVVVRSNHSLYVTYYEKHGVGIDATIFPPKQDFVFQNDTPGYLVLQAYTDEDEAFVSIYGTPDGRVASLQGPYFADTAPEDFRVKDRTLSRNEIAWERFVTRADGTEIKETIVSRYLAIPRSLPQKYLHSAAPEVQVATIGR